MTKKQVGEKRIYSAYTSILLFITKEVRTRTQAGQKAEAEAESIEGFSLSLGPQFSKGLDTSSLTESRPRSPLLYMVGGFISVDMPTSYQLNCLVGGSVSERSQGSR